MNVISWNELLFESHPEPVFLRESCLLFERKRRENWIDIPWRDHVSSFPTFHPVSRRINALENKISPRYSPSRGIHVVGTNFRNR